MRRLTLLLLLGPWAFADHLIEVSSTRYVGYGVDVAAIGAGDSFLPAIQTQRADPRGHWRSVDLALREVDDAKLRGDALGMDRFGGGVLMALRQGGEIGLLELRYEGRRTRATEHGALPVADLKEPRVLRIDTAARAPLLVVGHGEGLVLAAPQLRRAGRVDRIAHGGAPFVAASHAREGRLFVAAKGGGLLRLEEARDGWRLAAEGTLEAAGFEPRALADDGRFLYVGGTRGGRATLLVLDAKVPAPSKPLFVADLGNGSVDHVKLFDRDRIAVAGVLEGRSWVGILEAGVRARRLFDKALPGMGVLALGVNPAREGWSLGAATRDNSFHLLLVPGDRPLPRDWDPFAPPAPPPEPGPDPVPEPEPGEPVPDSTAVLPRVEADATADTEIVLLNLGRATAALEVRFVDDGGRVRLRNRVTLGPGQRVKLPAGRELLRGRRIATFDGYALILGGDRRDLVVDAVIRREGQAPESVRPHWR